MKIKENLIPLITFIFGTRPEAIKLAPVIKLFKKCKLVRVRVINTGQHREILTDVLKIFDIQVDNNLNVMMENPSLTDLNCKILKQLEIEFNKNLPSLVLVQGDTATSYASSLASFYKKIPVAHVEAGLRTNDLYQPFPEEMNRRLITQIASLHFAPTELAKQNLINENITRNVHYTGNTVIDSVLEISKISNNFFLKDIDFNKDDIILSTIHRRENWGENLKDICSGLLKLLNEHQNIKLIIPLHPNKIVREPIKKILGHQERVFLIEPLSYIDLVFVLRSSLIVITDSGGIQEEAPIFNKPVLITRNNTEREEGVLAGTSKLVGTKSEKIFLEANKLISNKSEYKKMAGAKNPFGDGKSSQRILDKCLKYLQRLQ